MKPILEQGPETGSADITGMNVEALKGLFPEAFTEGKIDFEILKQLLGGAVDEREEKYGLNWHGKRQARQLALTPSTGTLRPAPQESVNWDSTQNLIIEGDNLEVLKLLQKSYAGKVKMIYIDPPYNTGGDFVYKDDYGDSIRNYLRVTGQIDDQGLRLTTNSGASGRFHTNWLNMIYPRLMLAKNLLANDGMIFISIDDGEQANVRAACDEIFGPENFISTIIWHKKYAKQNDSLKLSVSHDYLVAYSRSASDWIPGKLPRSEESLRAYKNPDGDPKGRWQSVVYTCAKTRAERPNLYYPVRNPITNVDVLPDENRVWGFDAERTQKNISEERLWWGVEGELEKPRLKTYLDEVSAGIVPDTLWSREEVGDTQDAAREVIAMFGSPVFDTPKPIALLQRCLTVANIKSGDVVLDFFAGSGTTGHAAFYESIAGSAPQWIMVQLDAPLRLDDQTQKTAVAFLDSIHKSRNIAELTKERIRRAITTIKSEHPLFHGDLGFRAFKLNSTNIRTWEPNRDKLAETLEESVEHIKAGRTDEDILFEILLKLGLELTVAIDTRTIASKTVYSVGLGTLLVCLAQSIDAAELESLALGMVDWHATLAPAVESTVVFRDSAFADDVAKTNLTAILAQHGLENVRSL